MSILKQILDEPCLQRVWIEPDGTSRADVRRVGKNVLVMGRVTRPRRKRVRGSKKRCIVLAFSYPSPSERCPARGH